MVKTAFCATVSVCMSVSACAFMLKGPARSGSCIRRASVVAMATPNTYAPFDDEIAVVGTVTQREIDELVPRFRSWMYVSRDVFPDMGLRDGDFGCALGNRMDIDTLHVPIDMKHPSLADAHRAYQALDSLPKPVMISCTSNHRAGALATLYHAINHRMSPEEALSYAKSRCMGFVKNPVLSAWVTEAVGAANGEFAYDDTMSPITAMPFVTAAKKLI